MLATLFVDICLVLGAQTSIKSAIRTQSGLVLTSVLCSCRVPLARLPHNPMIMTHVIRAAVSRRGMGWRAAAEDYLHAKH